jgi:hypothetical protein
MTDAVRDHLARFMDWEEAHVGFEKAVEGLPEAKRGTVPPGFEHSPWQLLEHIRIAHEDILDFCLNPSYVHTRKWPDDYWPKDPSPPSAQAWSHSINSFVKTRDRFKELAHGTNDLTALVPTGTGTQTYLRAILMAADHVSYHVGQLVAVRRAAGAWK